MIQFIVHHINIEDKLGECECAAAEDRPSHCRDALANSFTRQQQVEVNRIACCLQATVELGSHRQHDGASAGGVEWIPRCLRVATD